MKSKYLAKASRKKASLLYPLLFFINNRADKPISKEKVGEQSREKRTHVYKKDNK